MNDEHGCSICANGQENYEVYTDSRGKECVQYDFRTEEGELFSCVSADLETCRTRRDKWLKDRAPQAEPQEQPAEDLPTPTEQPQETAPQGKPVLRFVDYSEKAFAIVGDTKAHRKQLKQLGGRFNRNLKCGAGWIFSKKRGKEVATALGFTA